MDEIQNLQIVVNNLANVDQLVNRRTKLIRAEKAARKIQGNKLNFGASILLTVVIIGGLSPKLLQVLKNGSYSVEEILRVYLILFVIVVGFLAINFLLLTKRYAAPLRRVVAKRAVAKTVQMILEIEQQIVIELEPVTAMAEILPANLLSTQILTKMLTLITSEQQTLSQALEQVGVQMQGKGKSRRISSTYQRERKILDDINLQQATEQQVYQNISEKFLD